MPVEGLSMNVNLKGFLSPSDRIDKTERNMTLLCCLYLNFDMM